MYIRRLISMILCLLLMFSLPLSALAAEYDLADGDIGISASESGQTVTQNNTSTPDSAPVITSSTQTSNTITVTTSGDAMADFTIKDVDIASDGAAIDVGNSGAVINVEGDNSVSSGNGFEAAIHVSGGALIVTSDTGGTLEAQSGLDGAAIGSDAYEEMSGYIAVTGDVEVTASSGWDGAGIGSGYLGEMSGTIVIDESAQVSATAGTIDNSGAAGVGSGYQGEMSGLVGIFGDAQVQADSAEGAGIGGGAEAEMSGVVVIGGNADVTAMNGKYDPATGDGVGYGSGIGSGTGGDMSGYVSVVEDATVTAGSVYGGTGIGSGDGGDMSGSIYIGGDAQVTAIGEYSGAGIGTGYGGEMSGSIVVDENADVTAVTGSQTAAIGASDPQSMTGVIAIVGNASVTTGVHQEDEFDAAAIDVDPDTGKVTYELNEDAVGIIGGGTTAAHDVDSGYYVLGTGATINGLTWEDADKLVDYASVHLDENGLPTNVYLEESDIPADDVVEMIKNVPLYWVVDEQDKDLKYTAKLEDGVLTVTAEQDYAVLTGPVWGMKILMNMGVKEVCFETKSASSTFATADLVAQGEPQDTYRLTHDGSTVTFEVGEKDIAEILK